MVSAAGISQAITSHIHMPTSVPKAAKGAGIFGGLISVGFCVPEFLGVIDAAKMGYNKKGEKVEGINWSSAITEFFKSIPKAAQYFIIPAVLGGIACGAGPIAATLATIAGFAIPEGTNKLLSKIIPHETELIAQACKEKGINIEQPQNMTDIRNAGGVLA